MLAQILAPLMAEVREKVGGGPVYLSFDIDGIDPAWALALAPRKSVG